jgi:hypothetical protein
MFYRNGTISELATRRSEFSSIIRCGSKKQTESLAAQDF